MEPHLHIVLYCPEIPQNTGNIGRMCALTRSRLHLIHPLGFEINDRHLKRSGMDYWSSLDLTHHGSWEEFLASGAVRRERTFLFSTRAERSFWDVEYRPGDTLLFGNEGAGVPETVHAWVGPNRLLIPQWNPALRSLNLSTAAGIAAYEALRQIRKLPTKNAGHSSRD